MYGLPKSVKIANNKLKIHIPKFEYNPAPITPGLWQNRTRPVQFSMVVHDYGVKYERQEDITHLIDELKTIYKIYEEWDGKLYCGLNLE